VVFWNLNLKLRIKVSLIVLLSLGIVYVHPDSFFTSQYTDCVAQWSHPSSKQPNSPRYQASPISEPAAALS
jgi:hypothetical protein